MLENHSWGARLVPDINRLRGWIAVEDAHILDEPVDARRRRRDDVHWDDAIGRRHVRPDRVRLVDVVRRGGHGGAAGHRELQGLGRIEDDHGYIVLKKGFNSC